MQKGDLVMADHPDSRSRKFIRSYGIVQEITKADGVIIEMADGCPDQAAVQLNRCLHPASIELAGVV